jgi:hypothetical protein
MGEIARTRDGLSATNYMDVTKDMGMLAAYRAAATWMSLRFSAVARRQSRVVGYLTQSIGHRLSIASTRNRQAHTGSYVLIGDKISGSVLFVDRKVGPAESQPAANPRLSFRVDSSYNYAFWHLYICQRPGLGELPCRHSGAS